MAGSYSWTLDDAEDVGGQSPVGCPIVPFTQQDFLDLFDRVFPPHYLEPLKSPGPGYEMFQAFAKLMARVSVAVEHMGCGLFIASATGGEKATGQVIFYREAAHPTGASVTVTAGTVVKSSRSGHRFITQTDVTFGPADLGPFTAEVIAEGYGYGYNLRGQVTTADGTILPGDIDTIDVLREDPDYGDITIQVSQLSPTDGGTEQALDAHGLDRDVERRDLEGDVAYRSRIRELPDTVTIGAVRRVMHRFFDFYSTNWEIIETWQLEYMTCWDAPNFPGDITFESPVRWAWDDSVSGNTTVPVDDPEYVAPHLFYGRWLGEEDFRGAFIVVIPDLPPIAEMSMAYDDTALSEADLHTEFGERAPSAYDIPAVPGFSYIAGALDGGDSGSDNAIHLALWDTLNKVKPAGVAAIIERIGE